MNLEEIQSIASKLISDCKENEFAFHIAVIVGVILIYSMGRSLYVIKYFQRYLSFFTFLLVVYRLVTLKSQQPTFLSMIITYLQYFEHYENIYVHSLIGDILGIFVALSFLRMISNSLKLSLSELKSSFVAESFSVLQHFPLVKSMLDKEKSKAEKEFEHDLKTKSRSIGTMNKSLPVKGVPAKDVLKLMKQETDKETQIWKNGKVSGSVYYNWTTEKNSHLDLLNSAFGFYSISNPLHPDIWPSAMKFEAEIVSMTASLVNGGNDAVCGCTTSGGTESIILAIKAHRDYYCQKYGITSPEMIAATSAHAAVDKACDMMNIRLIKVPIDDNTYKVNPASVARAISSNTIMIYSSAPTYPQGVIDPISKLARLARQHDVGLHVDCCLGGFVLPFAKKLGYNIPDFDFSIKGVTSMSLDTHKYGYALKGTSVVLYHNRELRQAQYFCYADWSGGLYTTPTIAGSRSGGMIAQCWASLVSLGEEGYLKHTKDILETTQRLAAGMKKIDNLKVIGNAEVMIVCFVGVNGVNIYSVVDAMAKKGWSLSSHQNPACAHICCTVAHVGHEETLLKDLRTCVEEVKADPNKKTGKAAIYGMTSSLPAGPVNDMLKIYNDVVLKV